MNIELSITGITESNKRIKLLKAAYALSDQLELNADIEVPWMEKAFTHKYISKKMVNGVWVYEYPKDDDARRANIANQISDVMSGNGIPDIKVENLAFYAEKYIKELQDAIDKGLKCKWLQNRLVVGMAAHFYAKRGHPRTIPELLRRTRLLPFVLPLIKKYGHVSHVRKNPRGGYYYELTGKAEIKNKKYALSVILTDEKADGKGLLYISVFDVKDELVKSHTEVGGQLLTRRFGPPVSDGTLPIIHNLIIPQISAVSMESLPDIEVSIQDITPENQKEKFAKAIRAVSGQLRVPVSIEAKGQGHGAEPFFYRAQEELSKKWQSLFSEAVEGAYSLAVSYFGLPEIRALSKADPLKYRGKIIYSPETGEPIKKADWDEFVKLLERFLNRKLQGADRIILDGKALGRVLRRMLKYNKLEEVQGASLQGLRYHGKTFDWISDSVKNMRTAFGDELSRGEMARIQAMQQSAAQRITQASDSLKNDVKQLLIDGARNRKSKSQVSQDLFDRMAGHTRDFQRIADTEIQNAVNNAFLLDEVHGAEPGEKVYFQRIEVIDGNTCAFCRKMHGAIVLWSDNPLPNDRIKDPVASHAIWDGKDWDGQKEFVANGILHPWCRGFWARYHGKAVDALVAHYMNEAELYNKAIDAARAEYKEKGVDSPHDKTPGYVDAIQGHFDKAKFGDAFTQARKEFAERGIANPTGRTPGFHGRIEELYRDSAKKAFDPSQPRDALGQWAPDSGGGGGGREPADSSTGKAKDLKAEDWGTPEEILEMARMERNASNRREAEDALENIISENGTKKRTAIPLKSRNGLTAYLRRSSIGKLTSNKQVKNVPVEMLYFAVANLDKLYSNAIEPFNFDLDKDANNDDLKVMHRLYSPMEYKGRIVPVKISVKEYISEKIDNKLYAIEAIDFEIPGIKKGTLGFPNIGMTGQLTIGISSTKEPRLRPAKPFQAEKDIGTLDPFPNTNIAQIFDPVNDYLQRTSVSRRVFKALYGEECKPKNLPKSLTWSGFKLEDRYKFAGFDISVENKKGSTRSGVDKDGHKWSCLMHMDYGYIRGTEGVDGDHIDAYIGPDEDAPSVYIIHQNDPATGKYDEDKVMLGFSSMHEARRAYLKQYDRPGFLGKIDVMPLEEFREKALSKKYRGKMVKSFSERVKETIREAR